MTGIQITWLSHCWGINLSRPPPTRPTHPYWRCFIVASDGKLGMGLILKLNKNTYHFMYLPTVWLIVFLAAPVHKMAAATGVWWRDSATSCPPAWAFKTWLSLSRPTFNGSWTHFASTSTTETSTSTSKCGCAMRDCSSRPSPRTSSLSTRYTHTHLHLHSTHTTP